MEPLRTGRQLYGGGYLQLGEYLFKLYSSRLLQLKDAMAAGKETQTQQTEELRREAAAQAQREFRGRMETERQTRTKELLRNALVYQKKQKYEEALGQLESLLAIEPQHDQALPWQSQKPKVSPLSNNQHRNQPTQTVNGRI